MKPIQNASGLVGLNAREYPVAYNTALVMGQVVKLSGGLVVSADANETHAILGICAENHPGTEDALNVRANGKRVLVYDNPELIFECPAPSFAASGGTATTVTAATTEVAMATADAFNGGYVKKGASVRGITDYAVADSVATFTVESGETAANGDEYTLFPPIGCAAGFRLDAANKSKVVVNATGCTKIKVIGHDFERNMLRLMAVEHSLGVEN